MLVIGLGSNTGNRLEYLRRAIQRLKTSAAFSELKIIAISPIYESDALLPEGAPSSWNHPYLNLNILCETTLSPLELLKKIKTIETELGRTQKEQWAPREIDIDILIFNSHELDHPTLKIPHPGLKKRPFALLPLADLVPQWKFPGSNQSEDLTVQQLVAPWRAQSPEKIPFRTRPTSYCLTQLMGVLNITPDSFSDGGTHNTPQQALDWASQLIREGVQIIDVGAESTRPQAVLVSHQDEWLRLEPVLNRLRTLQTQNPDLVISVDTRNAETARRAIEEAAVHWINDVSGFENPIMRETLSAYPQVDLVMMHSICVPPHRDAMIPDTRDPIEFLLEWANERIQKLERSGINRDRIIFDPGLGFGKTIAQSWQILRQIDRFHSLRVRILVGHSRKSFLTSVSDSPVNDRDSETLALSLHLAARGVDYIRVHQIHSHMKALRTWALADGIRRCLP